MENRSNNCKSQASSQAGRSTNSRAANSTASNEHKHPNQYTKGADDESAKDSNAKSAKNCR